LPVAVTAIVVVVVVEADAPILLAAPVLPNPILGMRERNGIYPANDDKRFHTAAFKPGALVLAVTSVPTVVDVPLLAEVVGMEVGAPAVADTLVFTVEFVTGCSGGMPLVPALEELPPAAVAVEPDETAGNLFGVLLLLLLLLLLLVPKPVPAIIFAAAVLAKKLTAAAAAAAFLATIEAVSSLSNSDVKLLLLWVLF
jgi:hypothetical protein